MEALRRTPRPRYSGWSRSDSEANVGGPTPAAAARVMGQTGPVDCCRRHRSAGSFPAFRGPARRQLQTIAEPKSCGHRRDELHMIELPGLAQEVDEQGCGGRKRRKFDLGRDRELSG